MKNNTKLYALFLLLIVIMLVFIAIFSSGCSSVQKSSKYSKSDSSVKSEKDWKSEAEMWKSTAMEYEKTIQQMDNLLITSDKDCPPAVERLITRIKEVCPPALYDSVQKLVNQLKSEIEYLDNGNIKYKGYISEIRFSRDKILKENLKLQDSLKILKLEIQKTKKDSRVSKEQEVKNKERTAPQFVMVLWPLIVAGIVVYYLTNKNKKNEKNNIS